MSGLPPPPPYTPRDPNPPALTPPSSTVEQQPPEQTRVLSLPPPSAGTRPPTYHSAYEPNSPEAILPVADGFPPVANASSSSPVILTPPGSPTAIQQDNNVETQSHDLSLSSSQAYFESRPSLVRRPAHVGVNHIIIPPDATPSDIPFPTSSTWTARDVDGQDWATFLNHLFPQHHSKTNAQIADRKIRAEVSHNLEVGSSNVEKLRSAQLDNLLGSSNNDEDEVESEEERRKRIEAVITEWNEGFFLPRGLKVVGVIQSFSGSSSSEQASSSRENWGCRRGRLGDRVEHHNAFPHHGWHGYHGHHGRRWHGYSHSHWNPDPSASHGYGWGGQRRRRGCGRNIPSLPDDPTGDHPRAPGASGVHPYIGLGEAVRHTAAQFGDAARYTALQLSEAARLTGQQVEEAARSTASQVSNASQLAGQQIEEAARQSAAQVGHFAGQQTRGAPTWNRTHTFGPPPSPSPSSHRRQSTSSSSRSFPLSLPSDQSSSHLYHQDSGANTDVTELTNAMNALSTPSTTERFDTIHTWNDSARRQYKERERERKVEIREMKLELKQKMLEAKEERKRVKDVKKAMKDKKKSEKRMRKAERRNLKLKEKMEKAEIKLVGKGSVNVLAKGDDSLTPEEKEWWKEKRFEEQEVGVLEKED